MSILEKCRASRDCTPRELDLMCLGFLDHGAALDPIAAALSVAEPPDAPPSLAERIAEASRQARREERMSERARAEWDMQNCGDRFE